MRTLKYEMSLVSYTDILGFEGLVKTRTENDISRILRVFKEAVDPNPFLTKAVPDDPDETFVRFSDLSITSLPLRNAVTPKPGAIFGRILHLVHAQGSLIQSDGILVRGGITVGEVEQSYGQLFGPGIIDAYHLESRVAKYPRIVVSQSVLDEMSTNQNLWVNDRAYDLDAVGNMLRKDKDGELFIDYLRAAQEDMHSADYHTLVTGHDKRINDGLRTHANEPKIREKYEWMRDYHDGHMVRLKNDDWS
jgi:hypothetical protein